MYELTTITVTNYVTDNRTYYYYVLSLVWINVTYYYRTITATNYVQSLPVSPRNQALLPSLHINCLIIYMQCK